MNEPREIKIPLTKSAILFVGGVVSLIISFVLASNAKAGGDFIAVWLAFASVGSLVGGGVMLGLAIGSLVDK